MARDRATRVRAAAVALTAKFETKFAAEFEGGARWHLDWIDGPISETIRRQLERLDVDDADIHTHRSYSTRAVGIAAIRRLTDGDLLSALRPDWGHSPWLIEESLYDVDQPDVARDPREERMLARLLAAATPPGWKWPDRDKVVEVAAAKGAGGVLTDEITGVDDLEPIEALTIRYAAGTARTEWERQAKPMSTHDAAAAALSDPTIDQHTALALLAVLAQIRAEQAARDRAAVAAARAQGASWAQIGAVIGLDEQAAQHWSEGAAGP